MPLNNENEVGQQTDDKKVEREYSGTKVVCTAFDCRWNVNSMCNLDRILVSQMKQGQMMLSCANYEYKVVPPERKPSMEMARAQDPKVDVIISLLPNLVKSGDKT